MQFTAWTLVLVLFCSRVLKGEQKVIRKKILEEVMVGTILLDLKKELEFEANKLKIADSQSFRKYPEIFDFDASNGVVRSSSGLDREKLCPKKSECTLRYNILRQNPFSVTKLEFEIEDINDNQPTFPKPYMKTNISESTTPGKFFLLHLAEDNDSPAFGVVSYHLDPFQNAENLKKFHLEVEKSDKSEINDVWLHTNEPLDREEQNTYFLKVIALDGGNKSGSATVEVTVLDLNDNKPTFVYENYETSVPENAQVDKQLITITASDIDDADNSIVNYYFTEKTNNQYGKYFKINKTSGIISLLKEVDYEKLKSIALEVVAVDQGAESLKSKTTVTVNIDNVNDNEPKIKFETAGNRREVKLSEDTPVKSKVVRFKVSDEDGDNDVQCHLSVNQSKENPFSLKKESLGDYLVQMSSALDRETDEEHLLIITCIDSEHPRHTSHSRFTVDVLDVNDNTPKFKESTYNISISENNKPFEKMHFNLQADDDDLDANGMITYSIHSHSDDTFQIDEKSAEIWTTVSLDRENNSFYKFTIMATDGDEKSKRRKSSSAFVAVSVMDENDEPPRFRQPIYNFTVPENRHGKYNIGQVTAIDLDLKSRKSFHLESKSESGSRFFKIDSKSGMIYATRKLDRESKSVHTLKAVVKDDHKSDLNDSAVIHIYVIDENDNRPIIDFPTPGNETLYISQQSRAEQLLTTVQARDLDVGNNSKLIYTISQTSYINLFKMDPNNGNIYLSSDLPPGQSAFTLVVLVKDSGSPAKMSVSSMDIMVDSFSAAHSQVRPITVQRILTEAHLAIVVGVAAGCLLIILVLICVVCSVTHKETKKTPKEPVPLNDTNYDVFNANIKYNPCNVENRMEDRENSCSMSENHSQLRESLILGEIPENSESIVLANLNRDMSLASSANDKKASRLYCSDAEANPDKCYNHNIGDLLNNRALNEDASMDKFRTLNNYRDTMHNSSEYAPTSPDWLMKALNQRKQSFSRWLNCEGTNMHSNSPHPYNIHEYSTIPSSNRLHAHSKFNEDPLMMMDNKANPMDMLPDPPYPAVFKNNMPVKSSPTYVGLYNRPFANTDGMIPDDDLALNSMQAYSMFQNLGPKTNAML